MAIECRCGCGRVFAFKNEFAGKQVACPDCGAAVAIPGIAVQADAAFDRDRFLLKQKRIAINEIYDVRDESGGSILYVRRPSYPLRRAFAIFCGLLIFIVVFGASFIVPAAMLAEAGNPNSPLLGLAAIVGAMAAAFLTLAVIVWLTPKRHVSFFRDPTRKECVLEVRQDSKFMPINMTYTVVDPQSGPIGRLSKNILYDLFRKRWKVVDSEGKPVCMAFEDSIILSLLRRLLGPLFGLLRTNFLIVEGVDPDGNRLGEFNRKLTLFDRYVLDLSSDPIRSLDRRLAVALGVMLDTGERR